MSHHAKNPSGASQFILLLLAIPIVLATGLQLGKKFSLAGHLFKSVWKRFKGPENVGIEELPELLDEGDFQVRYPSPVSQDVFNARVFNGVVEITYSVHWAHGQGNVEIVWLTHKGKSGMRFTLIQNHMTEFCRGTSSGNRILWDHDAKALGEFMISLRALVGVVLRKS
ncbi:hypothetical protein A2419_03565 [Candidatus Adlerbacteria bacterium RIFOXYC1_FULL_48_26]|uniref:Uncharacterized protein n=1 Tax=Candidatus Adlerbacteria bacterium RIFOXYC1_FULL_48_26 TaxID=1797247 RepID=A0A1F4Y6C5_9BACT|nr:MAG: hypothetical protein A2419_03565 [Candidatus Adlerbacteria bacterium RIFOXYC1_FULL_48_26]OGC93589.1 MAG: hypothetical protein A2389_00905 [Candidatus Adlerbacteria bacterium RIFOXYB1_FULL_48_10]